MSKTRIGVLTGGGDCPGLNAVIRGVTKTAINCYGMEVIGFNDGFLGMIERRFEILSYEQVSGILSRGGTILGTSNRADPFSHPLNNGSSDLVDLSDSCLELYHDLRLEALICIGGDGTMTIGSKFAQNGAAIVGVPKTIDKDVMETDSTFGFDSARLMVTEAIDRLHTTADAHHRVMVVEVMGRNAGWLALEAGIAGGADIILMPEIPYDINEVCTTVRRRSHFGKRFSIVVVSEGAMPIGGGQVYHQAPASGKITQRLGGCGQVVADQIQSTTGIEARVTVLGHLQRGGSPTPLDRLLGTQFAVKAMDFVAAGAFNQMVALKGNEMVGVPLESVQGKQKQVPLNSSLLKMAQAVGTSFGCVELP